LYLLATHPEAQDRVAAEAAGIEPVFGTVGALRFTRDVFRETLRLYPPVPMMVRETVKAEEFRGRKIRPGAQVVLSPWHLHRHERIWENPDGFDPDRWTGAGREASRDGYLPFSRGPRVCPGAGFAMLEGTLMLAHLVRTYRFQAVEGRVPVPMAHLTVRARDGIWLKVSCR
jgi:cytochrome P450